MDRYIDRYVSFYNACFRSIIKSELLTQPLHVASPYRDPQLQGANIYVQVCYLTSLSVL